MIRRCARWGALAGLLAMGGCADGSPTSADENLIPDVETYELLVPWSEFGSQFQVFGGFGSASGMPRGQVAHEYEGELEARTLVTFDTLPATVEVIPPDEDEAEADSAWVAVGGTLVVRLDTLAFPSGGSVDVAVGALDPPFDVRSASWTHAVDTVGHEATWEEPGGGPVREVGVVSWNPLETDSLVFELDSLTAAGWAAREGEEAGVARIESRTPGTYLALVSATFRPELRSELNPDTLVTRSAEIDGRTTIYDPQPGVDPSQIRLGGAPARRAYFRVDPPVLLEEGSPLCEGLPCPIELTPEKVVYAALVLHTDPSAPRAFQPLDTLRVQARPALAPERIPRSPLGPTVRGGPVSVLPSAFENEEPTRVEVSMTSYVRELLGGPDEDGAAPPSTLAFFADSEPATIQFGTFQGPGREHEPMLRLIFTLFEGVRLP